MAAQVLEMAGGIAVWNGADPRPRAAVEPTVRDGIRVVLVVMLLMLALCGLVATGDLAGAGTAPPDGPRPGLDL